MIALFDKLEVTSHPPLAWAFLPSQAPAIISQLSFIKVMCSHSFALAALANIQKH